MDMGYPSLPIMKPASAGFYISTEYNHHRGQHAIPGWQVVTPITAVIISVISKNKPSASRALAWLAAAAFLSLAVYGLIFTRTAYLLTFLDIPKYDLHLLVQSDPGLLWLYRVGFILLAVTYSLGAWAAHFAKGKTPLILVIIAGCLAGGILLLLYPFDAADMFDYIMHGRMLSLYGANPYQQVPADFQADPFFIYVGWTKSTSPYGPFWLQLSALTASLARNSLLGTVLAFKLLGGVFYLICIGFVTAILKRMAPQRLIFGVWMFACNPLVLYETFGHGHNDITLSACLLASVWFMIERHHSLAVLALVTGALFKHVTLLVIPVALVYSLVQLTDWKSRLRYLAFTLISVSLLVFIAYQPFWVGWKTIDLNSRMYMYTTSLPAIIHTWLRDQIDLVLLSKTISWISAGLTLLASLYFAWRAAHDRSWLGYTKASLGVFLFYLLLTCLWFQQWYMVWVVGLAAILPLSGISFLVFMSSFTVMTKVLISAPVLLWARPLPRAQIRELWLSLEVMSLPWLLSIILMVRGASMRHSKKFKVES
jgi:hypothetical protein